MADFSSETMKNDIFKVLKEKKKDQLISTLYQAKLSFQSKGNIETLPNEQSQRILYGQKACHTRNTKECSLNRNKRILNSNSNTVLHRSLECKVHESW